MTKGSWPGNNVIKEKEYPYTDIMHLVSAHLAPEQAAIFFTFNNPCPHRPIIASAIVVNHKNIRTRTNLANIYSEAKDLPEVSTVKGTS